MSKWIFKNLYRFQPDFRYDYWFFLGQISAETGGYFFVRRHKDFFQNESLLGTANNGLISQSADASDVGQTENSRFVYEIEASYMQEKVKNYDLWDVIFDRI